MTQYRELVRFATNTLIDPSQELASQQLRLKSAAQSLQFELAGKIKHFSDQLAKLRSYEYRQLVRIEDMRYLSIHPGKEKETAQLHCVTPLTTLPLDGFALDHTITPDWVETIKSSIPTVDRASLSESSIQRLGVVLPHLFESKDGVFIHISQITPSTLSQALKRLSKLKPDIVSEEEGTIRESAALS